MRDVEIKVFSSLHPEAAYLPIRFRTQVEVSRSFLWGDQKVAYGELHWVNGQIDFDDRGDLPDVISNKKSLLELTSCFSAETQISESDELNLYLKAGTRFAAPIAKRVQDSYASGSTALVLSFRVERPIECDMPVTYWEIDTIFRGVADKIPDNHQSEVS
jgi:hypothetical protein